MIMTYLPVERDDVINNAARQTVEREPCRLNFGRFPASVSIRTISVYYTDLHVMNVERTSVPGGAACEFEEFILDFRIPLIFRNTRSTIVFPCSFHDVLYLHHWGH